MFLNLTLFQLRYEWLNFYHTPYYPSDVTQPLDENTNFFNNSQYENLASKQAISLSTDSYVVNCYFYSITYSNHGAAIYLSQPDVHFLVEFSTFVECLTTGNSSYGGGLYISNADFAMNHVCAIECKSSSHESFAYVDFPGRTVNSIFIILQLHIVLLKSLSQ